MSDHVKPPAAAAEPAAARRQTTDGALLEVVNVHKTYHLGRVDVPVLRGASMDVQEGEWVAILGASGSGKSTLLHVMGLLDRPDPGGGEVRYCGRNLHDMGAREGNRYRSRSIGFVFQFYHLLPELTVLENAYIPAMVGLDRFGWRRERAAITQRAADLLATFGLAHRLEHRPRELSGGERQRVAIARALMNDPAVLLADEPTGNLDAETGGEILDLIAAQHRKGLTLVMVTHDLSIAARANRVVRITNGCIEPT